MAKTIEAKVTKAKRSKPKRRVVWEVWWYDGRAWECADELPTQAKANAAAIEYTGVRIVHFVLE